MRKPLLILAFLTVVVLLSACIEQKSPAVQAVEAYQTALLEMDSFQAVGTVLDSVTCTEAGTEGDAVLVTCEGSISLTYGEEKRSFDLSGRTFTVIQEGADWLVCGAQP